LWRGIERILQGRDPRDAWFFTQRFCGVCTTVHAMASVRAVEDALKLEIPLNAQLIRNLILTAHGLHDHVVHFYYLAALDWVDIMQVPKADPAKAAAIAESLSSWPRNSKSEMKATQDKIKAIAASGQLGIFTNGYWGHPAMRLSPEVNLIAVSHYLQALEFQRKANQIVGILGGKTPHVQNLTVGGVTNPVNLDGQAALNMTRLAMIKSLLDEVTSFVQQVYVPDVCAIGAMYADWGAIGGGVKNYLAVPDLPLDTKKKAYDLPGGYIMDANLAGVHRFQTAADPDFREGVTEDSTHAYYQGAALHPWKGETEPEFTDWQAKGKYSWVKAPRFKGQPMQMGPLAQVLVGYAQGDPLTRKWAGAALEKVSAVAGKPVGPSILFSTLGRIAARAIRCAMLSELAAKHWGLLVENISKGDFETFNSPTFPSGAVWGVGTHEAPRGTLSHWVVIDNGKIANYQAVVPSTWNASPRDAAGIRGPYEASLLHTPMANPEQPLEVLRTIHSFDPCLACAVHTFDPSGRQLVKVEAL
jgi:hydrogenase large subunit